MLITLEATEPIRTKGPWRTVVVVAVQGNGKNVPVQFRLGDSNYGQPVNTNWEGLAAKEVLLTEGQNIISANFPDGTSRTIVVTTGLPQAAKPSETEDGEGGRLSGSEDSAGREIPTSKPEEEGPKKKDPPQYTVALEQSEPNKISDGLWGITVTAVVRRGKNPISGVELRFEPPATEADKDQWDATDAAGTATKCYELPVGVHTIMARLKDTAAGKKTVVKIREEKPKPAAKLSWNARGKGSQQCIDFQALTADNLPVSGVPIRITNPAQSDWKGEQKTDQYGAASFQVAVSTKVMSLCATAPGCENYTIRLYNP